MTEKVSMQISGHGTPPGLSRHEIAAAARFYAASLMSSRLVKNLTVTICFEKTELDGSCLSEDFERPRDFTIYLNKKHKIRKALIALAHEMVHVKQYAKGELADLSRQNKVKFNKKKYSANSFYWLQPWEIEAYGYEYGLYRMYRGIKNWKQNKKKYAEKYILS